LPPCLTRNGPKGAAVTNPASIGGASFVVAVFGLLVASFVLLALPRNPFHPLVIFIVIPVTTLAYQLFAGAPAQRKDVARATNASECRQTPGVNIVVVCD
jgi:hypothetical protein